MSTKFFLSVSIVTTAFFGAASFANGLTETTCEDIEHAKGCTSCAVSKITEITEPLQSGLQVEKSGKYNSVFFRDENVAPLEVFEINGNSLQRSPKVEHVWINFTWYTSKSGRLYGYIKRSDKVAILKQKRSFGVEYLKRIKNSNTDGIMVKYTWNYYDYLISQGEIGESHRISDCGFFYWN